MPTYDYKCKTCGAVVEDFHSIHEERELYCKQCEVKMVKMIGNPKIIKKGLDWCFTKEEWEAKNGY